MVWFMKNNTIHNEIKANIARSGITLTEVVRQMNLSRSPRNQTSVQNISNKLSRGTIKYSEILEIAHVLQMDIVWSKSQKEELPNV